MPVFLLAIAIIATIALVRLNFIVIQGHVLRWQVAPILGRGKIANLRDYRVALYFVEQSFESGGFDRDEERAVVERLNQLLADFHGRVGTVGRTSG